MNNYNKSERVESSKPTGLVRSLSNRHIQLISISGAIGTGLFMGSGQMINQSGSSIIFTYLIIGFFLFFVMRTMGELLLSNLEYNSFADFCSDLIGPWAGFFVAWSYWFQWVITIIGDVLIIGVYWKFWYPGTPEWMPAFVALFTLISINMIATRLFGEFEFWFSLIKVVAIVSLIFVAGYMVFSGFISPDGVKASTSNLTDGKVLFPHGIAGFLAGFQIALYSFGGVELVGTTAAETKNPEKSLPMAINAIPLRIIVFYVLSLASIIAVSGYANINPDTSPFVKLFLVAGFPAAAGIINFVVLTSALSSANSAVYSTVRMVYGLARAGDAPPSLGRLSSWSVPCNALLHSSFFMMIGVALIFVFPNAMSVFLLVSTVVAITTTFVWSMILISYLIYRKKRPELHNTSRFKAPIGIVMSWAGLVFFVFSIIILAFNENTRIGLYITPLWFIALVFCYLYTLKKKKADYSLSLNE
ncbi:amino acid permease [Pantoea coffeiphila]|uniref:amino acid permease n=1 Tax=Pantoea coffeiphila TaxID=1465635 RepID=UPI00195F78DF|nr:amino acid permease [Pantoea coffeiphila]MBM7345044.1 D-serine/D-alanine/glycine transporter [Pantoea coffeiphila]